MIPLQILDRLFAFAGRACGVLACIAMLLLLVNVCYDVVARYAFSSVSIGLQELEWHLFACVFLLGIPYAVTREGHVRVDIFYERWSARRQAWVNLVGVTLFTLPFCVLVFWYGSGYAMDAFAIGERSGDPGGLPARWLIKSLIPVSAAMTAIASLGMITGAWLTLLGVDDLGHDDPTGPQQ